MKQPRLRAWKCIPAASAPHVAPCKMQHHLYHWRRESIYRLDLCFSTSLSSQQHAELVQQFWVAHSRRLKTACSRSVTMAHSPCSRTAVTLEASAVSVLLFGCPAAPPCSLSRKLSSWSSSVLHSNGRLPVPCRQSTPPLWAAHWKWCCCTGRRGVLPCSPLCSGPHELAGSKCNLTAVAGTVSQ